MVKDALEAFDLCTRTGSAARRSGCLIGWGVCAHAPSLVPNIKAVVSQIMAIPPAMLPDRRCRRRSSCMPRDQRTAGLVKKCVRQLVRRGVASAEIEVSPTKPSASFFLQRIERLTAAADQLHGALKKAGLLDSEGHLADDPRRTNWQEVLRAEPNLMALLPGPSASGPPDSLVADQSAVAEALNVAWAMHEIVSDQIEATLQWVSNPTSTVEETGGPAAPPHHAAPSGSRQRPKESNELR